MDSYQSLSPDMINIDKKRFSPTANSENGAVSSETIFTFRQKGQKLEAIYSGGEIEAGHILGQFDTDMTARVMYHCLTKTGRIKAGQAIAVFSEDPNGRVNINIDWQWTTGDVGSGRSRYKELTDDP